LLLVDPHQIAGVEPGVALAEHVAQDLLLGGVFVLVAVELGARADLAEEDAGRAWLAAQEPTALVLLEDLLGLVPPRARLPEHQLAHRAGHVVAVDRLYVAFGRAVELGDPLDVEPSLEIGPDVGAQAIARDGSDLVLAIARALGRVHEIAAQLAD